MVRAGGGIFYSTVQLLSKGSFKFKADFPLIVSFAPHTLSSVADWPAEINKIPDSNYWPICNGRESMGAKETIREKSALNLNEPLDNNWTVVIRFSFNKMLTYGFLQRC